MSAFVRRAALNAVRWDEEKVTHEPTALQNAVSRIKDRLRV
ncbi:hypothetical protein LX15_002176 [Streptoalloteichus tenebrarius]|uniref:Uncharacterized protein n=1 Tax=Streptoalloteichus tenebrarius (strain ATCC 17920 / DSM 40477 / JCM 4838 / CBS 697.72 / NBRC 16177 / NCIMB 11028 / NRRL B-12390 / A12253. 1 / ISP 5477) TaxID=1933 RepID=A0ABT1HSH6_STRSD|nr:hypothetical protein [Streptoalloteichus tenebrarius]MCP2258482.1 hypothetical protein [Streptoalloteichus tenebrarius]BFF03654.1 hypothetical protein GCM10020241_53290 [Streptoalloteichus tenebrarius]